METKTIILKEENGKRYELHLYSVWSLAYENELDALIWKVTSDSSKLFIILFNGSVEYFLKKGNKEEIAEKVCEPDTIFPAFKDYSSPGYVKIEALDSLLSAIGDYKFIVITETEI